MDREFGGSRIFPAEDSVQLYDIDDNDLDILGAGYLGHQVAWWKNERSGNPISWTKVQIAYGVLNACIAVAADPDNDDDPDVIATAQGEDEIAWWRNEDGLANEFGQNLLLQMILSGHGHCLLVTLMVMEILI